MKKQIKTILIIVFLGVAFAIILGNIITWFNPLHDGECLTSFAEDYCSKNNMTYEEGSFGNYMSVDFICRGEENLREKTATRNFYYFLESEFQSCKIKESHSFAKSSNEVAE